MATCNVSDNVIYSVTRKMNARKKAYCTYGRGPCFTRESGNLTQRDTQKTSGYLSKSVGIGQQKPGPGQPQIFTLVMKKRGKIRRPSQQRVDAKIVFGNRKKIKKQIEAQTKYRLYRGDLSKLAQRRIFQIQKIRCNYKKFLKKEAKYAQEDDDDDMDEDNGGGQSQEDLVEVD
eukprot:CAMPEP_0201580192 /NCGR_PEP_ID=MMETSP0190_2-20130828/38332_1 /ASSEMBLY_ACC=CAM_ASM_000263 /TAXON_ID=37353 /ORGANISM="Rosalina sp." /LENGTH=173 /DNA_ID=CAMNT_0048015773 /DNA_START=61 /DNA_END=582 /DNA_ORIENTATION=+